jgi:hypothetical protein
MFLVTLGSHATAQMTVMIPAYTMTCFPENPVMGPDGSAHQYAPYKMAWDGQNRVIVKIASAGPEEMGTAYRVKRVSRKIVLMQSQTGTHAYTLKLDFERGSVTYDYGRMDECKVTEK